MRYGLCSLVLYEISKVPDKGAGDEEIMEMLGSNHFFTQLHPY